MANLQSLTITGTGELKLPSGTTAQGTTSTAGVVRYNSTIGAVENRDNAGSAVSAFPSIRDGLSKYTPAPNGHYIAQNFPSRSSGYYWIQSELMPNPLQMYVDMTYENGGYDFYVISSGTAVSSVTATHSGIALGLDLIYPRSSDHWRALSDFVRNVLSDTSNQYLSYMGAVHRETTGSAGSASGNYSTYIMRDPTYYTTGTPDWRVPDGGRWWLRDTTFTEPNGDYTAYGLLGGYTFPNPYTGADLGFNDGTSGYSTGTSYIVSTNAKP